MSWLEDLPKVELHVHLEGSMSPATVRALASRHRADAGAIWPEGIPDAFSFDGFPDFSRQFIFGLSLLRTSDDLATVTDDLAATLAAQNVRYAEVTTTAFTHFRGGMSHEDYRDGLNEGRRQAADRSVDIAWVIDVPRDLEGPESTVTIEFLEGPLTPDGLVAIGLGGYEVGFPARDFAAQFARARALGLHSVPHAGETEGADSVRSAIDDLGAERIGHGVRAVEDQELVRRIVDDGVFLEVCPTSNVLLNVVDDLEAHPFTALADAGIRVNLNTDDPGWFATDLMTELGIGTEYFGLTPDDHIRLQRDALDASFASPARRRSIAAELDALALP
jgi:aminodeoxyfutalosine deaminase